MPDTNQHPPSQRKTATVLFADLSGFTAMSANLDPEEVRDVVNRYFEALATAVRRLLDRAKDRAAAEAQVATIYPRLVKWHAWWARARDPEGTGLVALLHPWESGMDNSPVWDAALAAIPPGSPVAQMRRDTGFVAQAFRPTNADYDRYLATCVRAFDIHYSSLAQLELRRID